MRALDFFPGRHAGPGRQPSFLPRLLCLATLAWCTATSIAAPNALAPPGASPKAPAVQEQRYGLQSMQEAVLRFMQRQLDGGAASIHVDILHPRDAVVLPPGAVDASLTAVGSPARLGRRAFRLQLTVDGRVVETTKILADVTVTAYLVTPVRLIRPQETIREEDITLIAVPLRTATHSFSSELDQVVGMRAVRPLRAHAPIHVAALARPYLVKKGDRVTIEAKRGGLRIQTLGVAQAAGHLGQSLAVTNVDSKRQIQARVTGPGLVEVDF